MNWRKRRATLGGLRTHAGQCVDRIHVGDDGIASIAFWVPESGKKLAIREGAEVFISVSFDPRLTTNGSLWYFLTIEEARLALAALSEACADYDLRHQQDDA